MNTSMILRVVWKDYRTYRSLWTSLFIITLGLQLLLVASGYWQGDAASTGAPLLLLVASMPVVFAVAVSSVAFSQEHEVGSYDYLRSLPMRPWEVLAARMLHAVAGTVALSAVLMITYAAWNMIVGFTLNGSSASLPSVRRVVMLVVLSIVCGTFFSLLNRRPLLAAVLTALAVSLTGLCNNVMGGAPEWLPLGLAGILMGMNLQLVRRWYGDGQTTLLPHRVARRMLSGWQSRFRSATSRMIWLHLKRMSVPYLVCIVATTGLTFAMHSGESLRPDVVFGFGAMQLIAGFLGVSLFYVDQWDRGYRFFAEHGVSPRFVWCVRNAIGVVVLSAIVIGSYMIAVESLPPLFGQPALLAWMPILAYLAGQGCMLMTRSPIIAGVLSTLTSACMAAWCILSWLLVIPAYVSVYPVAIALLLANLLRMNDWVLERDGARSLAGPIAVAGMGVVLTVASVAVFRTREIPLVAAGSLTVAEPAPTTPTQQDAAELLMLASQGITGSPWHSVDASDADHIGDLKFDGTDLRQWSVPAQGSAESEWLAAGAANLAQADAAFGATDDLSALRALDHGGLTYRQELNVLLSLMVAEARRLQADGQLEEAWQKYRRGLELAMQMRVSGAVAGCVSAERSERLLFANLIWWAAHDAQTIERIERAAMAIARQAAQHPTCSHVYRQEFQTNLAMIEGAPNSLVNLGLRSSEMQQIAFIYRLMPWERTRSVRASRWLASQNLQSLERYDRDVRHGTGVAANLIHSMNQAWRDERITRSLLSDQLETYAYMLSQTDAQSRNHRRAAVWQLCVIAYKLEHGAYPQTLQQVRDGTGVVLRDDVFTGQPFVYFPEGKDCRLAVLQMEPLTSYFVAYPQHHPFLGSPGFKVGRNENVDLGDANAFALTDRFAQPARNEQLTVEELAWWNGFLYGLP